MIASMVISKYCDNCNKSIAEIQTKNHRARFCSKKCRAIHQHNRMKAVRGTANWAAIPAGTSGAIGELAACADLMTRGYEVFRAQSPSCSCDAIAMKSGKILRVEIKSGYKTEDGSFKPSCTRLSPDKYDVLAIVFAGKDVYYDPPLDD